MNDMHKIDLEEEHAIVQNQNDKETLDYPTVREVYGKFRFFEVEPKQSNETCKGLMALMKQGGRLARDTLALANRGQEVDGYVPHLVLDAAVIASNLERDKAVKWIASGFVDEILEAAKRGAR